jgi:low temperature requirement protein LtrA
LPRLELQAPWPRSQPFQQSNGNGSATLSSLSKSRFLTAPKLWPAHEHHVRRPDWTELFFDLIFAAAISQLSTPLDADFSFPGIVRYTFLLALVFLAWFGYTAFSTQYAIDDVVQRALTIGQVFLVAVMAANATSGLSSKEAAGFGAAYGGVRAILALQYIRVRRLGGCRSFVRRRIAGLISAALIWASSALLPAPQRYAGWAVALLIDIGNSWPPARSTTAFPPGATHFPERFGLLTTILLGEFVASVMRGIETQMGWSFLAASAAVLSLGLGFAIWSCYSDGASAWETRHVRSHRDVARLRMWIALHFALFVGIGLLGVAVRRAIALPSGGHFSTAEQWITCSATAGIICVIMGLAATSDRHKRSRNRHVWVWLFAVLALSLAPLAPQIIASVLLSILFLCFLGQTALLIANNQPSPVTEGADSEVGLTADDDSAVSLLKTTSAISRG